MQIDDEIVAVTSAAAPTGGSVELSAEYLATYVYSQVLTITRAQLGTTAATHAASGGDLSASAYPIIHEFLDMDSCVTF